MIHEWRSYRLKPGAAAEYLGLFSQQGLPLVTRCLPLMGYWLAETGPLNTIHHLWTYADWAEREALRADLSKDAAWTGGFVPRAFALVEEQRNRFMTLSRSSPEFDAALASRRSVYRARRPDEPLFAAPCAGLIVGADTPDAVAAWDAVSGAPGRLALLPRADNPVPSAPSAGVEHIVLRPLAFSPL